jgi:CRISPR-associated protein Csx3
LCPAARIAACPDGEPAGIQEIYGRDSELAKNIKQAYKSDLTPEYAEKTARAIGSSNGLINIIDVGGKISPENELIATQCTHAVILAGNYQDRPYQEHWAEWESFCKKVGLKVIAKIHSDYHGSTDLLDTEFPLLTGAIHHLSRGENVSDRPMIQALSKLIIDLTYGISSKSNLST